MIMIMYLTEVVHNDSTTDMLPPAAAASSAAYITIQVPSSHQDFLISRTTYTQSSRFFSFPFLSLSLIYNLSSEEGFCPTNSRNRYVQRDIEGAKENRPEMIPPQRKKTLNRT